MCQECEVKSIETIEQARAAARLGAEFLTEDLGKGWELRVNTLILEMSHTNLCVIGQLYRASELGTLSAWTRFHNKERRPLSWMVEHGFDTVDTAGYGLLHKAWVGVINDLIMAD